MSEKIKLSYYLSHPIQYFSPLLRSLAEKTELSVYYFSDLSIKGSIDKGFGREVKWDIPLLQGYDSVFLKNYSRTQSMDNRFFDAVNPGVIASIRKDKAQVVLVNGWSYFSTILVIVAGRMMGRKIWLRAESPLNQELQKSSKVIRIKKILLGKLLFKRLVHRFLYIGTENRDFYKYYGVPEEKLIYTPYAVNNDHFQGEARKYKDDLPALKIQLGISPEKKVVLFTGKFIAKKRPMDLVKAFEAIGMGDWQLVMVGDGELRPEMEAFIKERGMSNVSLTGFVNQGSISQYYAIADVFVMCSGVGETWGLSVNEAMNFSKPVIVSATCGCSTDLVSDGINGFVFPEGELAELQAALLKVMQSESDRKRMGAASLDKINSFSIDAIVTNITKALYQ